MAPCQSSACFQYLFGTAPQYFSQNIQIHGLRKTHDIQRRLHLTAHGVDITQSIRGRYLSEGIGIVHHGRKKVQSLYHSCIFTDPIDRRVILAVITHQQVFICRPFWQLLQHMAQKSGSQLGRAAAPFAEYDFFFFSVHFHSLFNIIPK